MSENLFKALIKAQSEFKTIPKSKDGYNYKYAPLEVVWEAIRKPLTSAGLGITQQIMDEGESTFLITNLIHESGEFLTSKVKITADQGNKMSAMQKFGSAVTYLRRYALISLLSLTTEDEDEDAKGVDTSPLVKNKQTSNGQDNTPTMFWSAMAKSTEFRREQVIEYLSRISKTKGIRAVVLQAEALNDWEGFLESLRVAFPKKLEKPHGS